MHTIIRPLVSRSQQKATVSAPVEAFRQPVYDCQEHRAAMKLVVYVPGVNSSGVEIEGEGSDLTITARKPHVVRVNWHALNLENAQRDYQLRLRLGSGYDFAAMRAEISHGVLTVTLPKRPEAATPARLRCVA